MCVLTILNRKTLNVITKVNPRESMKSVIPTIFKSGLPSPEDVFHTMSNFQQLWTLYVYTMSNLFTAMNSLCLWLSRNKLAYEIILPYSHTLLEMRFRGTRQRITSTGTARPPTCLRKLASCPPRGPTQLLSFHLEKMSAQCGMDPDGMPKTLHPIIQFALSHRYRGM